MRTLLPTLAIVSTLLISCSLPGNFQLVPEVPPEKSPAETFEPVPSIVNVPIEMKTEVIQRIINEQLDSLLFESDTMTVAGRKPVKVKVWKKDTIGISLVGDELHYRLPLRICMQFSFTVGALGLQHTEYQEVEAEIALNFSSRLFVKNDWRIVTMTRPEGYEWLSAPVVKIRFLTIPVTPVVDFILGRQKDTFGGLVDSALGQMLDLKKMLHPLWMRVQEPMMISESPPVWLRLTPLGVYMTQLEGREGVIRGSVGIKTVAETFIGDRPEVHATDSLPEFVIPGAIDSAFVLNLYSEITYEQASSLARGYLQGRRFRSGLKEVIVQDVSLMGLDGYPVVQLDFTGSYRGRIFVIGDLRYDRSKETIWIDELAFDLSTKKSLGGTAARFLHDVVVAKIKPYLRFPLREYLLESQLMVQKTLCNRRIAENVYVTGTIDSLSVGAITITDRAIQAVILSRGSMYVRVND